MGAYVALLRGINVSGQYMMKMADLKNILVNLGFKQLSTYLQSGNVVFEAESTNGNHLEKIISEAVLNGFGHDIKVKVIPKDRFQQGFLNNPFTKNREIDTKQLYYIHFMGHPDLTVFKRLQTDESIPEQMNLLGEVIYVHYVNGYGRSKLHGGIFEKKLKVSATARNHNTMKHLSQMLDSL
jgi:uncharacterized protein (DUF1697 family)